MPAKKHFLLIMLPSLDIPTIYKPVTVAHAHTDTHIKFIIQIITRPRTVIATCMLDETLISSCCLLNSIDFSDPERGLISNTGLQRTKALIHA